MEVVVSTNNLNTYSVSELNYLRDTIENMNTFNQLEILKLFHSFKKVTLNENRYGTHINLSELSNEVLDKVSSYIKYVNAQESILNDVEKQKDDYKSTYFEKDNKDIAVN